MRLLACCCDTAAEAASLKALRGQSAATHDILLWSLLDKAFKGEL